MAIRKRRNNVARKPTAAGRLLETIAMRHVPQALHVAAVLGIADLLAHGSKDSDELARATGSHTRTLYRVLRTLVAAGVFSEDNRGRFRLTPLGQPLRSDVRDSIRAAAILLCGESELEGRLVDCVRSGKTAIELASGLSWIEYYKQPPVRAAMFNAAMTALSNAHYARVLDAYDFRSIRKLVDVGGGHGRLISMILAAYPKMRGVLFDLPHAREGGQKTIADASLDDRCQVVSGNFFDSVPAGGDAYILSRVIHDWADEQAVAILKVVRDVLPKGRLLLFETMIPSGHRLSYPLLSDLNMLIRTGGCERTEAEYRALYRAAGFKLTKAIQTGSPTGMTIIEGTPA